MNLSIIIPAYNCQDTILNTVNSLAKVKIKEMEIIIVNDGSKDDTEAICISLCQKYSFIKYYYQENSGVSSARNKGVDLATGKYIMFFDSDDIIDPDEIPNLINQLEMNEIDMVIFGMSFDYYLKGKIYRTDKLFYPQNGILLSEEWKLSLTKLYDNNSINSSCNKIFKRNLLQLNNIRFDEHMFIYEDMQFVLHYLKYCKSIYNFNQCIYHYRQTEDEGNAGRRLKRIDHLTDVISQIASTIDNIYYQNKMVIDLETKNYILTKLYSIIFREKIEVSSFSEINQISLEFSEWISSNNIQIENILDENQIKYINMILNKHYLQYVSKKFYIKTRHKIAVIVKSSIKKFS